MLLSCVTSLLLEVPQTHQMIQPNERSVHLVGNIAHHEPNPDSLGFPNPPTLAMHLANELAANILMDMGVKFLPRA
jgi:hypothetical protein